MDCELIGTASVLLGGGRQHESDTVDPAVGIIMRKRLGDSVQRGEAFCTVHFNAAEQMEAARLIIEATIQVETVAPTAEAPLVRRIIRDN
jgi:thymidine phosphorylase